MIGFEGRSVDSLKQDRNLLEQTLRFAGAVVKGRSIRCPFCDDHRPSAGIYESNNGDGRGWRYKCHSCQFQGSIIDVMAKIEKVDPAEILRGLAGESGHGRPGRAIDTKPLPGHGAKVFPTPEAVRTVLPGKVSGRWDYLDSTGKKILLIVFRCETPDGKTYRQVTPMDGGFILKGPERPLPLYGLPGLTAADTVVVCEGEKCCDAIRPYGFTATTAPMGAGKAAYADWTPIKGKTCYVWPDHDGPGHKHADEIIGILSGLGCPLYRINPDSIGLAEKQDAADFIEQCTAAGGSDEDVQAAIQTVLDTARPIRPSSGLLDGLKAIIDGLAEPAPLPFPVLGALPNALTPKTVTLFCGVPNSGKSFLLMQILLSWIGQDYPFAAIMLEDDRAYHLARGLAQLEGLACYFDRKWIKANPQAVLDAYAKHADTLDRLAVRLWDQPRKQFTYSDLLAWCKDRLKDGAKTVAIDPITIIQGEENPWIADAEFLAGFKALLIEHEAAGLIITHPRKGRTLVCLDDIAGGAAWMRFSHTILWIEEVENGRATIQTACGPTESEFNRAIHILKARSGLRARIAYDFRELRFSERGIIHGKIDQGVSNDE